MPTEDSIPQPSVLFIPTTYRHDEHAVAVMLLSTTLRHALVTFDLH